MLSRPRRGLLGESDTAGKIGAQVAVCLYWELP